MNYKLQTRRAFTLIELVVAVALLAMVLSFTSVIFKVGIGAYRTAGANAEIMQKLRAITDQLNADFKGLRKDGEIFVVWVTRELNAGAANYDGYRDCDNDGWERFDRIMFFADGDFQSYNVNPKIVRGNVARICYMLAKTKDESGNWKRPESYRDPDSTTEQGRRLREEDRRGRILSRTQHILTADPDLDGFPDISTFTDDDLRWSEWNNILEYEYDMNPLDKWKNVTWADKQDMLSVITDVNVGYSGVSPNVKGAVVAPNDPNTIHNLLCEGVGEFKVQGWYDKQGRWVPDVDSGDFYDPSTNQVPGVLYPYRAWFPAPPNPDGYVQINNISYPGQLVDEAHFNTIPGLGRALKFTFTLYDSKAILEEGRTFTHIIYLD